MKNFSIEIKWAVMFTMVSIMWSGLEKMVGLHDVHIKEYALYTNLFAIPGLLIYFLALTDKKKNYFNGTMDWSQGFVVGAILSFFIALLSPMAQYFIYTFMTPDFFKNIIAYKTENKLMTLETAKEYFNLKSYSIQSSLGGLSMGVTAGAIVSLFLKTKKN